MANSFNPDSLARELRSRGLPRAAIERLVEEWTGHWEELLAEQGEASMEAVRMAEARIGHPEVLVRQAMAEHRRKNWVARHPWWCCLVAPIPLTVLCFVLAMLLAIGLGDLVAWIGGEALTLEGKPVSEWPEFAVTLAKGFVPFMQFVPTMVATLLTCWLARRAGLSWRWLAVSGGLVALLAAALTVSMQFPETANTGSFMLGLGIPFRWEGLLQALGPISVCLLLVWWPNRRNVVA